MPIRYPTTIMRGGRDSHLTGLLLLMPVVPTLSLVQARSSTSPHSKDVSVISNATTFAVGLESTLPHASGVSSKRLAGRLALGPIGDILPEFMIYRIISTESPRIVELDDDGNEIAGQLPEIHILSDDDGLDSCPVVPLSPRMTTTAEPYPRIHELEAEMLGLKAQLDELERQLVDSAANNERQNAKYDDLYQKYKEQGNTLAALRQELHIVLHQLDGTKKQLFITKEKLYRNQEKHSQQLYLLCMGGLGLGAFVVAAAYGKDTYATVKSWLEDVQAKATDRARLGTSFPALMSSTLSSLNGNDAPEPAPPAPLIEPLSNKQSATVDAAPKNTAEDSMTDLSPCRDPPSLSVPPMPVTADKTLNGLDQIAITENNTVVTSQPTILPTHLPQTGDNATLHLSAYESSPSNAHSLLPSPQRPTAEQVRSVIEAPLADHANSAAESNACSYGSDDEESESESSRRVLSDMLLDLLQARLLAEMEDPWETIPKGTCADGTGASAIDCQAEPIVKKAIAPPFAPVEFGVLEDCAQKVGKPQSLPVQQLDGEEQCPVAELSLVDEKKSVEGRPQHVSHAASPNSPTRDSDAKVYVPVTYQQDSPMLEGRTKTSAASVKSPVGDSDAKENVCSTKFEQERDNLMRLVASPPEVSELKNMHSEVPVASAQSISRDSDAEGTSSLTTSPASMPVEKTLQVPVASADSLATDNDTDDKDFSPAFHQDKPTFEVLVASVNSLAGNSDAADYVGISASQEEESGPAEEKLKDSVASANFPERDGDAGNTAVLTAFKQGGSVFEKTLLKVSIASPNSLARDRDAENTVLSTTFRQEISGQVATPHTLVASVHSLERDSDVAIVKGLRSGGPRRNPGKGAKARHTQEWYESGKKPGGKNEKPQSRVHPQFTLTSAPAHDGSQSSRIVQNATPQEPVAASKRSPATRGLQPSRWNESANPIQEPPKNNQGNKRKNKNPHPSARWISSSERSA